MKKYLVLQFALISSLSFSQIDKVIVPYRSGAHWGYSDSNGKILINPIYDSVTLFNKSFKNEKIISYAKVFTGNQNRFD